MLLALGLVTSYRAGPRRAARTAVLAAGFLLLTLPYERHNLGGQMTGCALFLALFRLLDDPRFELRPARANALLAGVLTAGICTQRQNYVAAATGFVALFYLLRVAHKGTTERRAWLRQAVMAGSAAAAFLLPWCVLAFISARTAFYPLLRGNVNKIFGTGRVAFVDELKWDLRLLLQYKPVASITLLFLAAAMLPFARRTRALHAFMLATMFGFVLMMHYFRTFADAESLLRYMFAFTLAFCLASTLRTFREGARPGRAHAALAATAMAAVALGGQIVVSKEKLLELYSYRLDAAALLFNKHRPAPARDPLESFYRRLQDSVPPGEPLLVTLDHTYHFDGRRNRIYNFDHPGVVGPRGGPPAFEGPEALATYLQSVGIRYIAYVFGETSPEYKRAQWAGPRIEGRQGHWLQTHARFELDFFDTVTDLAKTRRSVFHEGDVRVLDLATPAAP